MALKRSARLVIIGILVLFLILSGVLAAIQFRQPEEVKREIPVYSFQHHAAVDYRVFVLPNPYFAEESWGPGQAYITPITDYIKTVFAYRFDGQGPARISGKYQVNALLTGYILKANENGADPIKIKVWEKVYPLLPETGFASSGGQVDINKEIRVNIREYADFAREVQEEYKSSTDAVELSVKYAVETKVATEDGQKTDSMAPALVIPIKGNSFTVEGVQQDSKEGVITAQKTVPVTGLKAKRQSSAAAFIILALALLLVLKKTSNKAEDPLENELKRIAKNYGDRIIPATGGVPLVDEERLMAVGTFEDLLKAADEHSRPILHEDLKGRGHRFYVFGEPLVYTYALKPGFFKKQ